MRYAIAYALVIFALPAAAVAVTPSSQSLQGALRVIPALGTELSTCTVGNAGELNVAVEPARTDPFRLIRFVDPRRDCDECQVGIEVSSVSFAIEVLSDVDFEIRTLLLSAEYGTGDCAEPTIVECEGDPEKFKFEPGSYQITVPLKCPCADSDFPYYIGVEFLDIVSDDGLRIYASEEQDVCSSFVDDGSGFEDIGANVVMFGSASCCNEPVPNEDSSWGAIKLNY